MQAQSARQYDPELVNKLALSQLAAEELIKREIKCPVCGFYLMDVYVNSISAVGIIIMELMKWHSSAIASWLTVL